VVQVNNVFHDGGRGAARRWAAFARPHVIFQYFDGLTGELRYSETVMR
jgi:hypothetical protein